MVHIDLGCGGSKVEQSPLLSDFSAGLPLNGVLKHPIKFVLGRRLPWPARYSPSVAQCSCGVPRGVEKGFYFFPILV